MTVAEELHFGRAAARLHIAQPSLSHQIRRLEQQLGVSLLARTSRHVELTPAGETLLAEGRRLLADAQRAIEATRRAGAARLTVGFYGSAAATHLPDTLRLFTERNPSVEVSVRELLLDRIDDIVHGHVDVAFTRLLPGQADVDIEVEVLAREARVIAFPGQHPLATRTSVTFTDLHQERFITNPVNQKASSPERWLTEQHRHGLPGREAVRAASIQEILALVASGRGVCLVPESVAKHYPRPDVSYVPVTDAEPAVVSLARRRADRRPAVEAFVDAARRATHAAAS